MILLVWDLFTSMLKNKISLVLLTIIVILHLFLLTKLIFFPFPELFIYPYLTNHGLKPYSQVIDQHFPGLMFLPVNFDNLGMNDETSARIWLMGTVFFTHLLLFFIGKKIFKNEKKALALNLFYLVWQPFFEGWVLWIDSFLPVLLLITFYFLYKRKLFLTGLMVGLSILFKQVLIPLAILIFIYLVWEKIKFKELLNYSAAAVSPLVLMLAYFLMIGVLNDFWYWTVLFNLSVYAQTGRGTAPTIAHLLRVSFVFGSSFLIFLRIRERESQIIAIFIIGALFGLSTRFDFVHFQPALPFAILATLYWIDKLWSRKIVKGYIVIYILIAVWWSSSFYRGFMGEKIYFFDFATKEIANKIIQNTNTGDRIFVFGAAPHLYQMSKTLPAGDIFVFQFPWFYKVAQERILEGIKKDKPNIIVADRTVKIEEIPITEFGNEIDRYILENYEKIDNVGTTEILRKKNE